MAADTSTGSATSSSTLEQLLHSVLGKAVHRVSEEVAAELDRQQGTLLKSHEDYAYQRGYEAGMLQGYYDGKHDGMVTIGTLIAAASFLAVTSLSFVYVRIREELRPWALRKVKEGTQSVVRVQRIHHPILDRYLKAISMTVGVEFYITFLPFLFWVGEVQLARSMTLLMALCVYTGNAIKDIICAPRPLSPPVERRVKGHGVQEYGMPSTHTLNGVCLAVYLVHFYYIRDAFSAQQTVLVVAGLTFWLVSVCWGRLYLGMHTPIDVTLGSIIGVILLVNWCMVDDFIDAWVTEGQGVILFQCCMSAILLYSYPVPLQQTPSYTYAVYFTGVGLGVISGSHRTYERFHSPEAVAHIVATRSFTTLAGLGWLALRMVVGMIVVLAHKFAVDALCRAALPPLCSALGLPVCDDTPQPAKKFKPAPPTTPEDKKTQPATQQGDNSSGDVTPVTPSACNTCGVEQGTLAFNLSTARRFLSYAAVGWAVTEPCMYIFEFIGI